MSDLYDAARDGDLERVQVLVEQGADMEKANISGWTPLLGASCNGHLEVVHYLLEQGANTGKADTLNNSSLHWAAFNENLQIAKLLMVYGADLNARNICGQLPIDMGRHNNMEIKQAIHDEPERRWNQQPRKRCVEQDRHTNATTSASAQQEEDEQEEQSNKKQPAEGEVEGGKVADEDQDSEPSSDDNDK